MTILVLLMSATVMFGQTPAGWTKGKGYGWVYGKGDDVGALNAIAKPDWVLRALQTVKTGKTYDLGAGVDKRSFKWPGHAATEIMSYRSPGGVKLQQDIAPFRGHREQMAFHSCALYTSDNVGTQIDGLGHITKGADNHWYNGVKEPEAGGDFGLLKMGAETIPPIVGKAVLIDVAGYKGVEALGANYAIGVADLEGALKKQGVDVMPGDIVMVRTGTMRYWGEAGEDHAKLGQHDSAGITLAAAKWLVEEKGAVMIGGDTSGLEVGENKGDVANAVHGYLLVDQGVHIGELHNLEGLARDRVYRFVYMASTNSFRGATAGFALRPVAIY